LSKANAEELKEGFNLIKESDYLDDPNNKDGTSNVEQVVVEPELELREAAFGVDSSGDVLELEEREIGICFRFLRFVCKSFRPLLLIFNA
jgi:hypothetical protein